MVDGSGGEPGGAGATGRSLKDSPWIVGFTLIIAVIGALTGTTSLYRGVRVNVRLTARYGISQPPSSLQVGVVNHSAQGVSIVGGALLLDDAEVAKVVKVMPNVPAVGDPRLRDQIFATAQDLPYAISAGQSLAGTVLFVPDDGAVQEIRDQYENLLTTIPDVQDSDRIRLRLEFTPGGSHDASVEIPFERVLKEARDLDHLPGWHSQLALDRHAKVVRIMVRHNTTEFGLSTLQLWRARNPEPIFQSTQPISQILGVDYYLPALPSGKYDWAVKVNGRVVAVGNFTQPCRGPESVKLPEECTYRTKPVP